MPYHLFTSNTGLSHAWLPCRFLGKFMAPSTKDAVLVMLEGEKKPDFVSNDGKLVLTSTRAGFTLSPLNHIVTPIDIHTITFLSESENKIFTAAEILKVDTIDEFDDCWRQQPSKGIEGGWSIGTAMELVPAPVAL